MRVLGRMFVGVLLAAGLTSAAQVKLPAVISDHMVLQADAPVPVWGMGTPGAEVTVLFAGQKAAVRVDGGGYWNVMLKPLKASSTPAEMTVTEVGGSGAATTSVVVHDVLVGEVWIAGGQSNMAYGLDAMQGKEAVLETAENSQLRLFNVKHATAAEPIGMHPGEVIGDVEGKWELSDKKSAANFSAVAYMFGAELQRSHHGAVGMISSNWGGTPIKTWMSVEAFRASPALASYAEEARKALQLHKELVLKPESDVEYKAAEKLWQKEVGQPTDEATKKWNELTAAGKDAGPKPKASRPEPQNPDPTGMPSTGARPQSPGISWNAMFAPIKPYAMKGALWYQGEANISHYVDYGLLLRTMVADWRRQWGEPVMEFLCVQLPGQKEASKKPTLAFLREQQASVLQLPHTGLAVTFDVGDPNNVHPANKVDVAHRLALLARAKVYGEAVQAMGPTMKSLEFKGGTVTVKYDGVGKGLVIAQAPWLAKGAEPYPLDRLAGFALAGADGAYHEATATITGDSVVLSAVGVAAPQYVRYAWDSWPIANLYSKDGLPAVPFRTDKEP